MKKQIAFAGTVLALALAAAGCATTTDIDRVERQTASINADLRAIKGNLDEINFSLQAGNKRSKETLDMISALTKEQASIISGLREDLEVIKRNQADLGTKVMTGSVGGPKNLDGQIEELRHDIANTNAKLDALKAALMQRLDEIEKAGAEAMAVEGAQGNGGKAAEDRQTTPAPVGDPNQIYQAAYLDYTKGNYDLAILGFQDYLKNFPDAEFAGNAQYWIAESLYSIGKYDEALPEFDKVIAKYASSSKVPGAMLKKGYALDALKRTKEAKETYEALINKYPNSEAAKLAEERIKKK